MQRKQNKGKNALQQSAKQPLIVNIYDENSIVSECSQPVHSRPAINIDYSTVQSIHFRLSKLFLPPRKKWLRNRTFPYKMITQIFKLVFVTLQLILFGSLCSSHVNFKESSELSFKHLFLRGWDASFETLPYPPSVGRYAVYNRDDFFNGIGFAIQQYNQTENISVNEYSFGDENRTVAICHTQFNDVILNNSQIFETSDCVTVSARQTPFDQLSDSNSVEEFLIEQGISIDFSRFLALELKFVLLSPIVRQLNWDRSVECFNCTVVISFKNADQTGQVFVNLWTKLYELSCSEKEPLKKSNFGSSQSILNVSPPVRRNLHIFIDTFTFTLALLSIILCLRSAFSNLTLRKEVFNFFDQFYGIRLQNRFFEFVSPWYILMLISDILIVFGSMFKLFYNVDILDKYANLSYVLGSGALFVWIGILRYIGFSYHNSLLLRTITRSIPNLLRFCVCAFILFFAFALFAWVVFGPYHLKFRTFMSTLECLFSLINGDDMYVTFTIIESKNGFAIFVLSRLFLYLFIVLFIYIVLNIFITIIFEAYEEVKEIGSSVENFSSDPLWNFINDPSTFNDNDAVSFPPDIMASPPIVPASSNTMTTCTFKECRQAMSSSVIHTCEHGTFGHSILTSPIVEEKRQTVYHKDSQKSFQCISSDSS